MKFTRALSIASVLTVCVQAGPASISTKRYAEPGMVRMPISKQAGSLSKRNKIPVATLHNLVTAYVIKLEIGTPPQTTYLDLDTGSSDTWVFAPSGCHGQCIEPYFQPSKSSTYVPKNSGPKFKATYGDGNGATGNYFTDNIQVAKVVVTALQMGLGTSGSNLPYGVMSLSFDNGEFESEEGLKYPTIIDKMFTQGLIAGRGYSLYLDDISASTGETIFGGVDHTKHSGNLVDLPIVKGSYGFNVTLQSLSITYSGSTTQITDSSLPAAALLDSGTSLILIRSSLYAPIASAFSVVNKVIDSVVYNVIDCGVAKLEGHVGFGFHGISISVPFSELAVPIGKTGVCQFAFYDGKTEMVLGDPFLRSAYVYYDLDRSVCAIAQTKFT